MNAYEVGLVLQRPDALLDGSAPALQPKGDLPDITTGFLERRFRHAPLNQPWILALTVGNGSEEGRNRLQAAIATHYEEQVRRTQSDVRDYRKDMLRAFLYGALFLGLCLSLHRLLEGLLGEDFPRILDEGLIIIGWVAMWRPAELLTYAWVPLARRLKLQRKLSKLTVRFATG